MVCIFRVYQIGVLCTDREAPDAEEEGDRLIVFVKLAKGCQPLSSLLPRGASHLPNIPFMVEITLL